MENDHKGFREFLIKLGLFVGIGIATMLFISIIFRNTPVFAQFFDVPPQFRLEPPNFRTTAINAILFGILAFILFAHKKLTKLRSFKFERSQFFFVAGAYIAILAHYAFAYAINSNQQFFLEAPIFWGAVKSAFIVVFASLLCIGVFGISFISDFLRRFKKEICLFTVFTIGFYFLIVIFQSLWIYFSTFVATTLANTLRIFYENVTLSVGTNPNGPILGLNKFLVVIGKPCSGIDSLLLFTGFFTLAFILDRHRINWKVAIPLFLIGMVGMFVTNIIRLFLLMLVGVYISPTFAAGLFHSNVGWLMFMGYGLLFWLVASRFIYKTKRREVIPPKRK